MKKHIAILGAGPSGLYVYKQLVEKHPTDVTIDIFESKQQLGAGMPYSSEGANVEHITNVSGNEIPPLVTSVREWIQTLSEDTLQSFGIDRQSFHSYRVLPRLLFGQYLSDQFSLLQEKARQLGLVTNVHLGSSVTDIIDEPEQQRVSVEVNEKDRFSFDAVIICTGHDWPKSHEGKIPGYFDSPYPPAKLRGVHNQTIALRGASLTAIDALRTLARANGTFRRNEAGKVVFESDAPDFRMVLHSRDGFLPAIRFHLEEPLVTRDALMDEAAIAANRASNEGFLSLDFVFDENFKQSFKTKDPDFYDHIKDMKLEQFVETMMAQREQNDPFDLFRAEYQEAAQSIRHRESIYWKEMLAALSFSLNYPAKYFSAEDMQRLTKVLMPLISLVIAFVPQSSAEELLALHAVGRLSLIAVGSDSAVEPQPEGGIRYQYTDAAGKPQSQTYTTYVDCVGQPHLNVDSFPFESLKQAKCVSQARLAFQSAEAGKEAMAENPKTVSQDSQGTYFMQVPGITITDDFQIVNPEGVANERIYNMAVPYMGGYNPDYSGLDFAQEASARIIGHILALEPASV